MNATNKPAVYPYRSFVEAGGLLSHGPDLVANMQAAGEMVAQVLDRLDQGLTTDVKIHSLMYARRQLQALVRQHTLEGRWRPTGVC